MADSFVTSHASLDERLDAAFVRYDAAFRAHTRDLTVARLDLSLLLWEGDDAPNEVQAQLASDGLQLLRETPPL